MGPVKRASYALASIGFVAAMVCLEGAAAAQELDSAIALYEEADFEAAINEFNTALESPELERETAVECHRYLAALYLVVENPEMATEHAEAAVALEPTVVAPEGAPPDLNDLLDEVRADQGEEAARFNIVASESTLVRGQESTITARLVPAPRALAQRLTLRCDDAEEAEAESSPPEVEVIVTPGITAREVVCEARAETESGAVMVETEEELEVEGRSSGRRRWPWILGVTGGVVLVGVITAVAVVAARPENALVETLQVEGW